MQFDEPFDERQADPQSTVGSLQGFIDLSEHVKDFVQHFRRHADACVSDDDLPYCCLTLDGQPDLRPRLSIRTVSRISPSSFFRFFSSLPMASSSNW